MLDEPRTVEVLDQCLVDERVLTHSLYEVHALSAQLSQHSRNVHLLQEKHAQNELWQSEQLFFWAMETRVGLRFGRYVLLTASLTQSTNVCRKWPKQSEPSGAPTRSLWAIKQLPRTRICNWLTRGLYFSSPRSPLRKT